MDLTKSGVPAAVRFREWLIEKALMLAGVSSVVITLGIVGMLVWETIPFFTIQSEALSVPREVEPGAIVSRVLKQTGDRVEKHGVVAELKNPDGKLLEVTSPHDGKITSLNAVVGQPPVQGSEGLAPIAIVDWRVGFFDFFGDTQWTPAFSDKRFGIWALICGTFVTTLVAIIVAVPVGTITAIWLSEYCKSNVREVVKPVLELLSAVPTVVYGYFALLAVTPVLQWLFVKVGLEPLPVFNMLSAGLVMGVMIIPYVASLSEDAMRAVPMQLREGSYAMGATRLQTAVKVLLPAAFSGVTAAYILAFARAIGETMIVAIAAGQQPIFTADPTREGQTLTAYIVGISKGDTPWGSLLYRTIYACGLTLLVITLLFNLAGYYIRKRYREQY